MADVDDEFLALVGGDDASDEEADNSGQSRAASESPEPEAKQSKGTAAAKSRRRRQDDSDEEEEGEAPAPDLGQRAIPLSLSFTTYRLPRFLPRLLLIHTHHFPFHVAQDPASALSVANSAQNFLAVPLHTCHPAAFFLSFSAAWLLPLSAAVSNNIALLL
ncbi:hypothetical protein F5Y03DRAFT_395966 [Xylaria venustula]|nr:hypothetical protein F5Y03DRAFT_395966 [Xylaria venustula]